MIETCHPVSRYSNVKVLVDLSEHYDLQELENVLNAQYDLDDVRELAEDIAFVIISLWARVPKESQKEFKESLLNDISKHQFRLMFKEEEDE